MVASRMGNGAGGASEAGRGEVSAEEGQNSKAFLRFAFAWCDGCVELVARGTHGQAWAGIVGASIFPFFGWGAFDYRAQNCTGGWVEVEVVVGGDGGGDGRNV